MLRNIGLGLVVLISFLHTSLAYTFKVQTNSLAPGDSFRYDVIVDNGDVEVVDVLLVSSQRGNSTIMLENYTMKTASNQGFTVPKVPAGTYIIRLVQSSNKEFILDSTQFQITGITTINGSSSTFSPSTSSIGSAIPTDNGGNRNNPNNARKSGTKTGAIAGGVVGGLAALGAAFFFLLCCFKRARSKARLQDLENEKLGRSSLHTSGDFNLETTSQSVVPFPIPHRPTLASLHGQSSPSLGDGGPLPSKGTREYAPPPSMPIAAVTNPLTSAFPLPDTSNTHTAATISQSRAEHLRRERECITHEIALLEQQTALSTFPGSGSVLSSSATMSSLRPGDSASAAASSNTRDREMSEQLAMLQEQVRQIEARQAYVGGTAEDDFSMPPPVYDGPLAPRSMPVPVPVLMPVPQVMEGEERGASDSASGSRLLPFLNPTINPVVDVKTPIS